LQGINPGVESMSTRWEALLRPAFLARHYRSIVFALVLINTALIVFLVVYIWTYGLESRDTRQLIQEAAPTERVTKQQVPNGTVVVDNLIVWSVPGGSQKFGASRGVLEKGDVVPILGSTEVEGELWLEVGLAGREGWVPAKSLKYIRFQR